MLKTALASAALSVALVSQAATGYAADAPKSEQHAAQSKVPLNTLALAESDLLASSTVQDANGKKVGKIESLVIDVKSGQVAYAIIGANGKDVAVPWQRLQAANQPQTFDFNGEKTALDNAPAIDRKTLSQVNDPQERQQLSSFWESVPVQQAQLPSSQPKGD